MDELNRLAQLPDIIAIIPSAAATILTEAIVKNEPVILSCYVLEIKSLDDGRVRIVLRPTGPPRIDQ